MTTTYRGYIQYTTPLQRGVYTPSSSSCCLVFVVLGVWGLGCSFFLSFFLRARFAARRVLRASRFACFAAFCFAAFCLRFLLAHCAAQACPVGKRLVLSHCAARAVALATLAWLLLAKQCVGCPRFPRAVGCSRFLNPVFRP